MGIKNFIAYLVDIIKNKEGFKSAICRQKRLNFNSLYAIITMPNNSIINSFEGAPL